MEPGLGRLGGAQQTLGFALERVQQRHAPARIEHAHAPQMGGEAALFDESRQHALRETGRMPVGGSLERGEGIHRSRGHYEVAEAETRSQDLAEGSEIEHAMAAIQRVERCQGPAGIAILAVVVVLKDPRIRAFGPIEQRQAAP